MLLSSPGIGCSAGKTFTAFKAANNIKGLKDSTLDWCCSDEGGIGDMPPIYKLEHTKVLENYKRNLLQTH